MFTSLKFLAAQAARRATLVSILGALLLTGCASGVTNTSQVSAVQTTRPDTIYVYPFNSAAGQVKLDTGIAQRVKSQLDGTPPSAQQSSAAIAAQEQVANEIVRKLQSMGLRAARLDGPAPDSQSALLVQGSFDTIDAGNRRRRVLVGFGAGKSQVATSVQVSYKPAGGAPRVVQTFDADADSGKAPGIAATAGVGAAAGRLATSAAVGAGLHTVSETKHADISSDAQRLGDSIAKQIAQLGVTQGWMSPGQIN